MNYFKVGTPYDWGDFLPWASAWDAVKNAALLMDAAKECEPTTASDSAWVDYKVLGGWVRIHSNRVSYQRTAFKTGDRVYYINREFLEGLEESNAKEVDDSAHGA